MGWLSFTFFLEIIMRSLLLVASAALLLSACANQSAPPAAPAEAPKPAAKAPQCYSSEHGQFFDAGSKANISGVDVVCEKTSDGKNAQWMGKKH